MTSNTTIGIVFVIYLNWLLVAGPLRRKRARLKALTISDYFEKRFNAHPGGLRLVTAIVILVFFLIYTSAGLAAGGKLFEVAFDLYEIFPGFVLSTLVIVITTLLAISKETAPETQGSPS